LELVDLFRQLNHNNGSNGLHKIENSNVAVLRRGGGKESRLTGRYRFRTPTDADGMAVAALIAACPPLDGNSLYCNLLQCSHFADTCVLAEEGGRLKGWVSGFRSPREPDAIFVWQIAVHESARGCGLGLLLLEALFELPATAGATRLAATVSPSNRASRALFTRFARAHGLKMDVRPYFDRHRHFGGHHESEDLISIAPIPAGRLSS
jgi:L-2,4-diaminobutyric acid acetyltransferase